MLLDTNVWRYLIDSGRQNRLHSLARAGGIEICVCPAVIIETLCIGDIKLRNKIIHFQTMTQWKRLMPDAYLQCDELRSAINQFHPDWMRKTPNEAQYRKLFADWKNNQNGWWHRARQNVDKVASIYRNMNKDVLPLVRQQSKAMRSSVIESKKPLMGNWLSDLRGSINGPNGENYEFDGWRVYSATVWNNLISTEGPVREWLGCHVDLDQISGIYSGYFTNFWLYEVQSLSVRRQWISSAIYAMQADRKVTDGNPIDQTIGVHLVDVDVVISADRNLVYMFNRCHKEAPFVCASALLIDAGDVGVEQLFEYISSGISANRPN
jgi:hypothetical protein